MTVVTFWMICASAAPSAAAAAGAEQRGAQQHAQVDARLVPETGEEEAQQGHRLQRASDGSTTRPSRRVTVSAARAAK